jgi:hypothetical protein
MIGRAGVSISPELRGVERAIDTHYRSNDLTRLPFAQAAWQLLAVCEDMPFLALLRVYQRPEERPGYAEAGMFAEGYVSHLKYSLAWLEASCPPGGRPHPDYHEPAYGLAYELSELAEHYIDFETAFTCASRGIAELRLEGSRIYSFADFLIDSRYDAYDQLVRLSNQAERLPDYSPFRQLTHLIAPSIQVRGERFSLHLNPQTVGAIVEILSPLWEGMFSLPYAWQFSAFSLLDFKKVWKSIASLAFTHLVARKEAAVRGCYGAGFADALILTKREDMVSRLTRYSGVAASTVDRLVTYLTYGAAGISRPDPAIQPLIPLSPETYAIAPYLVTAISPERNFTVLLNRLASERQIYSRLVQAKEALLRDHVVDELAKTNVRFWHGTIAGTSGLPDVDLAVVSDAERTCLLLELKWFIEPDEIREVIEKSEEIAKGVAQQEVLARELQKRPQPILDALSIGPDYQLLLAVASSNTIGLPEVQSSTIPVVNAQHLVRQLLKTNSLATVVDWLAQRKYLPEEGKDFRVLTTSSHIGPWELTWRGVELTTDEPEYIPRSLMREPGSRVSEPAARWSG